MTNAPKTSLTLALLLILSLNVVIEAFIALGLLFAMPMALQTGFQVPFRADIEILGLVIAFQVMVHIAVHVLAITWVRQGKREGIVCAYVVGIHMLVFGIAAFAMLGNLNALILDGARGVAVITLAGLVARRLP